MMSFRHSLVREVAGTVPAPFPRVRSGETGNETVRPRAPRAWCGSAGAIALGDDARRDTAAVRAGGAAQAGPVACATGGHAAGMRKRAARSPSLAPRRRRCGSSACRLSSLLYVLLPIQSPARCPFVTRDHDTEV